MMRFGMCATAVVASLLAASGSAQRLTIPEVVASGGGISSSAGPSGVAPAVEQLVAISEVVVVGTIVAAHSSLTDDQMELRTDYDLQEAIFIKPANMGLASRPGVSPSISFRQRGGTLNVGGKTISYHEGTPLMEAGMRGIFFLRRESGYYSLADLSFAVVRIDGDQVAPLTRRTDFAPEFRGLPPTDVINRLFLLAR